MHTTVDRLHTKMTTLGIYNLLKIQPCTMTPHIHSMIIQNLPQAYM